MMSWASECFGCWKSEVLNVAQSLQIYLSFCNVSILNFCQECQQPNWIWQQDMSEFAGDPELVWAREGTRLMDICKSIKFTTSTFRTFWRWYVPSYWIIHYEEPPQSHGSWHLLTDMKKNIYFIENAIMDKTSSSSSSYYCSSHVSRRI